MASDPTNVTSPLGKVTAAAPTYVADQMAPLSLDEGGNLRVALGASPTIDIGDVTTLNGSVTAINAALPAGDNNIGNVDVVTLPALPAGTNNIGDVDAIQSGTWTVQPGNTANTTAWRVENGPYLLGRATADAQIKAGAGFIHTISIAGLTATPTAGLLTVYDSLTETGTVVYAEWVFATVEGHTILLDVPVGTGIYVGFDGTLANVQATVVYR